MTFTIIGSSMVLAVAGGASAAVFNGRVSAGHAALVAVTALACYGAVAVAVGLVIRRIGRRRGWFKASPMLALDRRERRRVWRKARHGETLTPTEAEIVRGHLARVRRVRKLGWVYPAAAVLEGIAAVTNAAGRWLFVAAAVAFTAAAVIWPLYVRRIDRMGSRLRESPPQA